MATFGSRNTNYTCVIMILVLIMMMMINNCLGSFSPPNYDFANPCNGTNAECDSLVENYEELLMDTEEHRRVLAQKPYISLNALKADNTPQACSGNCQGRYAVKNRGCLTTYHCPS